MRRRRRKSDELSAAFPAFLEGRRKKEGNIDCEPFGFQGVTVDVNSLLLSNPLLSNQLLYLNHFFNHKVM